ncbi:MAG: dTDP-4-dehydrorhamnose reductase [Polyangiales bacterium]
MNEVLIIGSRGMLGRAWVQLLKSKGISFATLDRPQVDLERPQTLFGAIDAKYRYIINCAAWTAVDAAEEHENEATLVNGHSVGVLGEICLRQGAKLVQYSTDYVFDGKATSPYPIDHPRSPVNAYGRSKAVGEELLEVSEADYLIVRTSWLYAAWGQNFVRTMAKLTSERSTVSVVDDQRGRPSYCAHVAQMTWELLRKNASGIYHVTDGGDCTWFDFAREIGEFSNPECEVKPCATKDFPRPAPRPQYSVLAIDSTEQIVGAFPAWQQNLSIVMEELER